ncbi:MAG: Rrf2 family transcriptional regulator [Flavobacteriales bacterium]|nr:Rrf2 family transcriptional regulator [Flavobacteriales bacterium]
MLSKRTKYGLKALAALARTNSRTPLQSSTIARDEGISVKFLESIMLNLRKAGYLGAKKGKGGGYYLMQDPKDIPLTDIIRLLEGPIALVPCVSLNYYEPCDDCRSEESCSIHRVMLKVRDSMLDVFRTHTVADLI